MTTLRLAPDSRYKDTNAYSVETEVEFALWEPPAEFTDPDAGSRLHRVGQHEIGFLDKIAVDEWGAGYEPFWWAIAQANAIIDPETEMYAGMVLTIPPRSLVVAYRARAGLASDG